MKNKTRKKGVCCQAPQQEPLYPKAAGVKCCQVHDQLGPCASWYLTHKYHVHDKPVSNRCLSLSLDTVKASVYIILVVTLLGPPTMQLKVLVWSAHLEQQSRLLLLLRTEVPVMMLIEVDFSCDVSFV